VSGSKNLQLPLPCPALRQQLLTRIEQEAMLPFLLRLPAVAAGPDPLQDKACSQAAPQQQRTALLGRSCQ
jgi:hypothetical protein